MPWRVRFTWLAGFVLVTFVVLQSIHLVATVALAFWLGPPAVVVPALVSWRLPALGASAGLLWLARPRLPGLRSLADVRAFGHSWLAGAAVLLAALALFVAGTRLMVGRMANPLGLLVDAPGREWTARAGTFPPYAVTTNHLGFRGPDFPDAPTPGFTRVAVVGDSFTWGTGIPYEDTLASALGRELSRVAPGMPWEVVTVAKQGLSLFGESSFALQAVEALGSRVVVISVYGTSDWNPFDHQRQIETFGATGLSILWCLGVSDRLAEAGQRWAQALPPGESPPVAGELEDRIRRLGAAAESRSATIILWEVGPRVPFHERLGSLPGIRYLWTPPDSPMARWHEDPSMTIPGDGHPTGKFNASLAALMAPEVARAAGAN